MSATDITVWLAFGAGFLSFISPCCLPLYPSFLSYVTGVSVSEVKEGRGLMQRAAFLHTLCFVIGFSIVFFALGLSASWVGKLFSSNQQFISQLGGVLIFVIGLIMIGIFKPQLLTKERRFQLQNKPAGYLGSAEFQPVYENWREYHAYHRSVIVHRAIIADDDLFNPFVRRIYRVLMKRGEWY